VLDPELGLVAPRGDVAALGALVARLLDDPDRRATLGDACRQWVVARFSEDLVVERLEAEYRRVAPRPAVPVAEDVA
jgi:glycosyltransferase involved in cell wall biosynthesis